VKSYDIIGYVYRADTYCPSCTPYMVSQSPEDIGIWDTEAFLTTVAERRGLDRFDEHSYDSDEFPKVIFCDQFENDICGNCHEHLMEPYATDDEDDE
jgi:hypothetical protein